MSNRCNRCGKICKMEEKTLVRYLEYYRDPEFHPKISSNHKTRVVEKFNFCNDCIKVVNKLIMREVFYD